MPRTIHIDEQIKGAAQLSIKALLRFHMARTHLNYEGLTVLLNQAGIAENARNLANKIGKGELPAWLFLSCLKVMGANSVNFADWPLTDAEAEALVGREPWRKS
jgi:hypothetical protein